MLAPKKKKKKNHPGTRVPTFVENQQFLSLRQHKTLAGGRSRPYSIIG